MPWYNYSYLILLAVTVVDSKYGGLPDQIKNVVVRSFSEHYGHIEWTCHETDIISFNLQILEMNNSTNVQIKTVVPNRPYGTPCDKCAYLLANTKYEEIFPVETVVPYIMRVSAINKYGEGPPSLDVIFQNRPSSWYQRFTYRPGPEDLWIESNNGTNVKLQWTDSGVPPWYKDSTRTDYTVHYRDISESKWNTLNTNNKWIILETLQNGIVYNAYVTVNENNHTSLASPTIPISIDDPEKTGLPEPVITIRPFGRFLAVNCSLPPNFNMRNVFMKIRFGNDVGSIRTAKPYGTLYTLMDSGTAECQIEYSNPRRWRSWSRVRKASQTWKKNTTESLDNDYLQRHLKEVGMDWKLMSANKIRDKNQEV